MTCRTTRGILRISFVVIMAAGLARGQKVMPLYLDERPGEDPFFVDVTELTDQYPRPAVKHYQKAVAEARKGKRASAVTHLEEAIRLAPEFFSARNGLGILYQKMTRYGDAEREYLEARRLNPRSAAPLVNLGSLRIEESASSREAVDAVTRREMLSEALASLKAAIEIQPSSAHGHYLAGIVYYLTDCYEDAESYLKRALDLGASKAFTRIALANLYIRTQAWAQVLVQLDAYLAENRFASNRRWIEGTRREVAKILGGLR